jgi:hypothetical protein
MGAHTHSLFGTNNPLASVQVMVRRDQRSEALRVLRRIRAEADGLEVPDDLPLRAIDDQGRCVVCRYDMRGLTHQPVCPECGTNLEDDDALARAAGQRDRAALPGVWRLLAVAFVVVVVLILAIAGLFQMR